MAKHLRVPHETFKATLHKVLDKKATAAYVKVKEQLLIKNGLLYRNVVLLQCGSSPFKFKSFSIKFRIWNNSLSSDVLYIQASISISPKYESK